MDCPKCGAKNKRRKGSVWKCGSYLWTGGDGRFSQSDQCRIQQLAAEVERLQETLEELPKMADGVPVYHDQPAWVRWCGRITHASITEVRRDGVLVDFGMLRRPRFFYYKHIFSSREALEAAEANDA